MIQRAQAASRRRDPEGADACLRRLERNGLVARRLLNTAPIGVEYELTALGRSLQPPFRAPYNWTVERMDEVDAARRLFDARQ